MNGTQLSFTLAPADPHATLHRLAEDQAKESILPQYLPTIPDEERIDQGLGILVAHYYEWDGARIMNMAALALEDANFHDVAAYLWLQAAKWGATVAAMQDEPTPEVQPDGLDTDNPAESYTATGATVGDTTDWTAFPLVKAFIKGAYDGYALRDSTCVENADSAWYSVDYITEKYPEYPKAEPGEAEAQPVAAPSGYDIATAADPGREYVEPPAPAEPIESVCELCGQPGEEHQDGHTVCGTCADKIVAYTSKVQARYERLLNVAEKVEREANQYRAQSDHLADIMNGQPILIGHHSEKRHRRDIEKMHNWMSKSVERYEHAEHLRRRANHPSRAISSDDPEAVIKLKDKLAKLEALQAEMNRINKAIRKVTGRPNRQAEEDALNRAHRANTDEARKAAYAEYRTIREAWEKSLPAHAPELAALLGCTVERAVKYLTPDFCGRTGMPDYALSNNSAEIRRCKQRIEDLSKKAVQAATSDEPTTETTIGKVTIVKDTAENRLRMVFPGKPSRDIIGDLKGHGFHWSPSNMAWQRMLTADAEYWAGVIAERANK